MKPPFLKLILFISLINSAFLSSQIQFSPYINIETGSWPEVVAIGDVNNDGLNDVVLGTQSFASSPNDFKILVFIQNTSGNLNAPIPYSYTNSYQNIRSINIGDLNQDGLNDVIIGYHSKIGIFYQNNDGNLNPSTIIETSQFVISVKCADLNNDSITDFAVSFNNLDYFSVFYQSQPGTFIPQNYTKSNTSTFKEIEIGDVNNDGKNDIIAISSFPSNIYTYLQNSTYSFDNYTSISTENLSGIGIGDLNNDGKNDIAYSKGGNTPSSKMGILYQNNTPEVY